MKALTADDITTCADELRRELNVRERIYGRWIDDGKLTISAAKSQIESIELALAIIQTHDLYPAGYEPVDRSARKEVALPWRR